MMWAGVCHWVTLAWSEIYCIAMATEHHKVALIEDISRFLYILGDLQAYF